MELESDAREERLFQLSHEFGEHLYFLKAPSLPDGFRMAAERIKSGEERIRELEEELKKYATACSRYGAEIISANSENAKLREALHQLKERARRIQHAYLCLQGLSEMDAKRESYRLFPLEEKGQALAGEEEG